MYSASTCARVHKCTRTCIHARTQPRGGRIGGQVSEYVHVRAPARGLYTQVTHMRARVDALPNELPRASAKRKPRPARLLRNTPRRFDSFHTVQSGPRFTESFFAMSARMCEHVQLFYCRRDTSDFGAAALGRCASACVVLIRWERKEYLRIYL